MQDNPDWYENELKLRAELDQVRAQLEELQHHLVLAADRDRRHEQTINALKAHALADENRVRQQLGESETMRAALSAELQRVRSQLMEIRQLATGAVTEEYQAMVELEQLGYLSDKGRERMDALGQWLHVFSI